MLYVGVSVCHSGGSNCEGELKVILIAFCQLSEQSKTNLTATYQVIRQ